MPVDRARTSIIQAGLALGLALAAALALPAAARADVVFSDRFARGDIDGFAAAGRSVSASFKGPVLKMAGDGVLYVPATAGLRDYLVEVEGRNVNPVWGVGAMARITPDSAAQYGFTGYGFQYDVGAGGLRTLAFGGMVNDTDIVPPMAIPNDGGWHKLSLRVEGSTITTLLDGVQVSQAVNGLYPTGAAGLRVWRGNSAQYRRFRVSSLGPAPAPTYVLSLGDATARGWGATHAPAAAPAPAAYRRRLAPTFDDAGSAYGAQLSRLIRTRTGSLQADWDNFAVSGYGAREIAGRAGSSPLLSRIAGVLKRRSPDLVTVSVGARELALVSGRCARTTCTGASIRSQLAPLSTQVRAILVRLDGARSHVPIAVTLLPPPSSRSVGVPLQLRAVAEINRRITLGVAAARHSGAKAFKVSLQRAFRGHGCRAGANSFMVATSPVCILPNAKGQAAIATAVLNAASTQGVVPRG